jgi:hypothetical protein
MKFLGNWNLALAVVVSGWGIGSAAATPVQPDVLAKGWVWADQANATLNTPYTPSVPYQYNLRTTILPAYPFRNYGSGTNTVTRTSVGAYRVTFPGLAVSGGTVHVTAYGGNHTCKVGGWSPSGADLQVTVNCFAAAGTAANGAFTALFYKDGSKSTLYANAYLWADQPSATACYTPSLSYQFNSRGAANTICRVALGEYDVTMPHMEGDTARGGHVQVTAYGAGSERCKVRSWSEVSTNVVARVGCSTASGAAVDTRFTASFLRAPGDLAKQVAEDTNEAWYVHANLAPTPSLFHQSDSYESAAAATLESPATGLPTGNYRVHLTGVYPTGSTAIVTAYGSGAAYCTVTGWNPDAGAKTTKVDVRCYDSAGAAVNSVFELFYTTDDLILF